MVSNHLPSCGKRVQDTISGVDESEPRVSITGREYSLNDIHNDARLRLARDNFVKKYLPELKRKLGKKER